MSLRAPSPKPQDVQSELREPADVQLDPWAHRGIESREQEWGGRLTAGAAAGVGASDQRPMGTRST